ncbi:DUF4258 domain-containing protein [Azohydromonas aeria]|nr:DUF4258 domain-containing protein [Azohydromonas aeria]
MFSVRFNRPVIITRHAQQRMQEREISLELLLQVIDTGHVRYSDEVRLWT